MILKGNKIYLKPLTMNDLNDFYEYASNEHVGNSSLWKPHESIDESRKILKEFVDSNEFFGIFFNDNHKLIGVVGLHEDEIRPLGKEKCREIGYGLNYDYWGRGIMTEVCDLVIGYGFSNMDLEIITGYTSEHNRRSQNVMEKVGMNREGVLRKAWINYRGEIYSKYCYSILTGED